MKADQTESDAVSPSIRKKAWIRQALIACVIVLAVTLPFLLDNYRIFQLTLALCYALAVLGLNLLTGYNGQISIGHSAFYAMGAYSSAILTDQYDVPYWATLPAAAVITLVFGFLVGLPALRLEGMYLAVATFALSVSTPQLLKHDSLAPWTGGVQGIVLSKPEVPLGLPLNPDQWLYLLTLAIVIAMTIAARNLLRGRIGRAMIAIRDHPLAASTMGVNTAFYKSATFGISAMFTGVAGALGAITVQFVAPDSFTFFLSITFIAGAVVGGLATISGAFFGALFIQFVPNVAEQISKSAPWAIYGVFLIAFTYAMPTGVAGLLRRLGLPIK